jgi:hypothetical protein
MEEPKVKEPKVKGFIHVNEFLAGRNDISEGTKAGFKVFVREQAYQESTKAFEKLLKKYQERKI